MSFKKTLFMGLLASTMLAGCDGDDRSSTQAEGTFVTKEELNSTVAGLNAANADASIAANTRIGSLETALGEANKTIAGYQELLTTQDRITKNFVLAAMQPGVTQLQTELERRITRVEGLADLGKAALAFEQKAADFDLSELSSDDKGALKSHDGDFDVLKKDIAATLDGASIDLAKGTKIIEKLGALPPETSAKDASGLHEETKAVTASLKNRDPSLAVDVEKLRQRFTELTNKIKMAAGQNLPDYVNTMRGAQSSGDFTRGNTFPATAMPFGFNMWSPVNRDDGNWFYQFETGENGSLIDTVRGFAVVHEPSPWIGNRQTLAIVPIDNENVTNLGGAAQKFQRKNEIAHAHYYSLIFDNGTRTEITPTDHAAYFRFTVPADKQVITVMLDTLTGGGSFSYDAVTGAASGYTDHGSPRMFFYATFDAPVTKSKQVYGDTTWVQFDAKTGKTAGMKIATSFLSVEQAKANLEEEIDGKTFDNIKDIAEAAWLKRLGTIRVTGATEDQKIILYSNMYRAFLYPNSAWENVKDKDGNSVATYMSPYTSPPQEKKSKIWVNNGFWDTYRTTWPLYTLLVPNEAGEMLNGFVNGYKDGGWVTRWSGPGYNDSMVATSSDVILADAYMKGVRNFDIEAAYASMLRNATNYSGSGDRGRKGMAEMPFYGYKPGDGESVAWSLEAYLNDFGISQMAKELGKTDDAAYLANRAISYPNIFDSNSTGTWAGGWFRTKNTDGSWAGGPSSPQSWGYGYTEGNAWSYAFLAPQDGQGVANLYGGRDKLKAKLDQFFTTTPGYDNGSYWTVIHEIKEAAKVNALAKVGEYQHSNQTVHHSIYMYNYAGAPYAGQKYLRDVMDKLYFSGFDKDGNSTGEGYIGDEDNGEQSAWYILSAMGFYPVSMGRPEYAIGAPYFETMSIKLENGKKIIINAPGVSSANRYVQSLKLNGKPYTRNYLLHADIKDGATLDFVMGPNPTQWGTGEDDVPTSITKGSAKPTPLASLLPAARYDVTASTATNAGRVFDRDSGTEWSSPAGTAPWIEADLKAGQTSSVVKLYTLTSAASAGQDPAGWTLKGSDDGTIWETLDERMDQAFTWRRQTRPFAIKDAKAYARYRLEFTGTAAITVPEFELLAEPPTP